MSLSTTMRRLFFLTAWALILVGCADQPRPLKPLRPTPTPAGVVISREPTLVNFTELNTNPQAYLGQRIRVSGALAPLDAPPCTAAHGPDTRWALIAESLQMSARGYAGVIALLAEGTPMTVDGFWRLYQGPVGCGKEPPRAVVWYIDVVGIVEPNPIIAGATAAVDSSTPDAGGALPTPEPGGSAEGGDGPPLPTAEPFPTPDPFPTAEPLPTSDLGGYPVPTTDPFAFPTPIPPPDNTIPIVTPTAEGDGGFNQPTLEPPTPTPSVTPTPREAGGPGEGEDTPTETPTPTPTEPSSGVLPTETPVGGTPPPGATGTLTTPGAVLTQPPTPPGTPLVTPPVTPLVTPVGTPSPGATAYPAPTPYP